MADPTPPPPLNTDAVTRAALIGAGVALLIVLLFLGLWFGLAQTGMAVFPRLVLSICTPPALAAAGLAVYILSRPQPPTQ